MLGGNFVYKCPTCGNLIQRGSIMSGNSFGAKVYSDGKVIARMLKEFPELTQCKKCENFFWISKSEEVGSFRRYGSGNAEWENADKAEFLTIGQYVAALKGGVAQNSDDEMYIRQNILWAFNDRLRKDKPLFESLEDEAIWNSNLDRLLELLDITELNDMIMMAEIYRSKGDFKQCMSIIDSIHDPQYHGLKAAFAGECAAQNCKLFQLNQ